MSNDLKSSRRGLDDLDALATGTSPSPAPVRQPPASEQQKDSPARSSVARRPRPSAKATAPRPRKLVTRSQVVYLPDDQIAALKRLSLQTDRSKSDLVREAIALYLEQQT